MAWDSNESTPHQDKEATPPNPSHHAYKRSRQLSDQRKLHASPADDLQACLHSTVVHYPVHAIQAQSCTQVAGDAPCRVRPTPAWSRWPLTKSPESLRGATHEA